MTDYPPAPYPGVPGEGNQGSDGGSSAEGPSAFSPTPTCPRHPDRVSYVRCQRCERPVCPECQQPAAVGVQCVDCVKLAAKQMRPTRTLLGGRVTTSKPYVTRTLIGLNLAVFLLGFVTPLIQQALIFWPAVGMIQPYRAITSGFLHGGLLHLAFNMYALWLIGPALETMLGRWRFVSLYFLSLFGGTVAVVLFASPTNISWVTGVVGASGAVFGLFGAFFFIMRRLGRDAQQILVIIGINVVLSFVMRGISWQAHFGGLVIGAVLALVFTRLPRKYQLVGGVVSVVVVALALIVGYFMIYVAKTGL